MRQWAIMPFNTTPGTPDSWEATVMVDLCSDLTTYIILEGILSMKLHLGHSKLKLTVTMICNISLFIFNFLQAWIKIPMKMKTRLTGRGGGKVSWNLIRGISGTFTYVQNFWSNIYFEC
jgi:hypothetical protein